MEESQIDNIPKTREIHAGICYYYLSLLVYSCLLCLSGGDDDEDHLLGSMAICFPCRFLFGASTKFKNCCCIYCYNFVISSISILLNLVYFNLHLFIIIFSTLLIISARILCSCGNRE